MKRLVLPLILALALSLTSCGVMIEILDSMLEHEHTYVYTLKPGATPESFDLVKTCTVEYCSLEPIISRNVEVYVSTTVSATCTEGAKTVYSHDVDGKTVSFTVEGEKSSHTLSGIPIDKLLDGQHMIDSSIPGVILPSDANLVCQSTATASYQCSGCNGIFEVIAYISHVGSRAVTLAPTCTAEGRESVDCTRCNTRIERTIAPLGHDHTFTVTDNQSGTSNISRTCSVTGCTSGIFTESGVTELTLISGGAASCQSPSKTVYSYVKGGETKTVEISSRSINHQLNGKDVSEIANPDGSIDYGTSGILVSKGSPITCGKLSSGFYLCSICSTLTPANVFVRPHHIEPSEMWTVTPTTCREAGKTIKECLYCDYTEQQTVPEEDLSKYHRVAWSVTLVGTDISTALSSGYCQTPGCSFSVSASPMDHGSYSCTTKVTDCYSLGEINHTWTVGGTPVSYTTTNLSLGHRLHDKDGNLLPTWALADENGYFDTELEDVGIFANTTLACGKTTEGYYRCAICDDVMKVTVTKNHNMSDFTYRAPTCTTDGLRTFKCDDCGSIDSEIIEAYHTFEYVHDIAANTLTYRCTRATADCNKAPEVINLSTGNLAVKRVITPSTCTDYGKAEYTFFRGSNTITFIGLLERSSHKTTDNSGNEVNADSLSDAYGRFDSSLDCIKYFAGNSEPAVGHTGYGYFVCTHCDQPVRVEVVNTGK